MHSPCDHSGEVRYTRRVFANGTTHICLQCSECRELVRSPLHANRPFIRLWEVPADERIYEWQERRDEH